MFSSVNKKMLQFQGLRESRQFYGYGILSNASHSLLPPCPIHVFGKNLLGISVAYYLQSYKGYIFRFL